MRTEGTDNENKVITSDSTSWFSLGVISNTKYSSTYKKQLDFVSGADLIICGEKEGDFCDKITQFMIAPVDNNEKFCIEKFLKIIIKNSAKDEEAFFVNPDSIYLTEEQNFGTCVKTKR